MNPGTVYLIGAGPGDPGLITVRGQELLAIADMVYDHRVGPSPARKPRVPRPMRYKLRPRIGGNCRRRE